MGARGHFPGLNAGHSPAATSGEKDAGFQQQWGHDFAELGCQNSAALSEPSEGAANETQSGRSPAGRARASSTMTFASCVRVVAGRWARAWLDTELWGERFLLGDWDRPLQPI